MTNLNFGKFTRETLAIKVADAIIQLINYQQLQPGDRLPPERKLAELLGVSRPVIRSAVKILCDQRLVEIRDKKGLYCLAADR